MRDKQERQAVLELRDQGWNNCQIADELNIPRSTVRDIARRYADVSQLAEEDDSKSSGCRFESCHRQYAYLLGMYLGDGYINRMPKCERLRITCDAKYPGIVKEVKQNLRDLMPENKVGVIKKKGCVEQRRKKSLKNLRNIFSRHAHPQGKPCGFRLCTTYNVHIARSEDVEKLDEFVGRKS
jgi:hypothetical protein